MTRHRLTGALTAALLALSLAGCTEAAPAPTPTAPVADPAPSADPVVAGPTPRFDATCDDLVDAAALQSFVGPGAGELRAVDRGRTLAPDVAAIDQLGALMCGWDDGQSWSAWQGPPEGQQVVRLHLVRDAAEAAQRYVDTYAGQIGPSPYGPTASGPRCVGVEYGQSSGYCHFDAWLSDTWIEFTVDGIALDDFASDAEIVAAFTVLTDRVVETLAAEPPHTEAWTAPVSASTATDCEQLASDDEVRTITGAANTSFGPYWDGPRIGQYSFASDHVVSLKCWILIDDTEASLGGVSYLPGGDWAFETLGDDWASAGGVETSIAGLDDGDAVLRCADPRDGCILDLRVDRDWVRISMMAAPPEAVTYVPADIDFEAARAAVVPLAERIVANLLLPAT